MTSVTPSSLPNPSRVSVRRVEAVVNAASGSVGPGAADMLEQIISRYAVGVRVANAKPGEIEAAVRAAVESGPDLVVTLAGDGTAALAARLAGFDGPIIAPLPGGTMNMLPHALYGPVNWHVALESALSNGVVRPVSGGEIGGELFYVAAILGESAVLAKAREAVRAHHLRLAWLRLRYVMGRALSHKLHYTLGDGLDETTAAITLMCPLVSRGVSEDSALEVAALDPKTAMEALRLGFNAVTGDWRADPSVQTTLCQRGSVWSRHRISAVLDGEPCRLDSRVGFQFKPNAFRALAPAAIGPTLAEAPAAAVFPN